MTKTFTLLLLFIGNIFFSYSKSGFQLIEINPSDIDNSTAKINTNSFRFDNTDYFVVQPKNNSESYLKDNGLTIESYFGNGYYFVSANALNTNAVLQRLTTNKIGYISHDTKIDESLKSIAAVTPVTVMYAGTTNENMISMLELQTGITIIHNDKKYHHFSAYATAKQLKDLVNYPFIYFITKYYPNKNPLIVDGAFMLGVNQVQETQPFGYNLKGEGINIGIWDDGAVGAHVDLPINNNFVIDKERNDILSMTHTTEVAGCLGASGNIFGPLKGIAPKSTKYYWDLLDDIINEIEEGKSLYSVDISNHSYNFAATNCFQSGLYIPEASDLDKLVYTNPTLLPIVAVGNSASTNCAIASDTFNSVDIGFQGCKNALTVGWLFANEKIVENSGRGPTEDGRIKPELVAKGFQVTTLSPNNNFSSVFGSSFSAPQVSGIAALLYQKYKEQFAAIPNASLIKALLINTARDLGNSGPDYTYGFGKPDAYRAVKSLANNYFFEDNVSENTSKTHSIIVPSDISQLKITLSWTDKEGNPIADKSLVNNLDLKLITPIGDTILPWKLNPSLPKNIALRGLDNSNTNEQITISNPVSGTYTIVVKGVSVPFGPQNYSVAYYNQGKKIELTYPNGGEIIDVGTTTEIRWFGNGIDSLAKIEFSDNNGASWQTIINNVQLNTGRYTWNIPNVASNQCLVKITSGNNIDVSQAQFTIGTQIFYPSINHTVCDRTIKINWPAVTGASGYKVYLFTDTIWNLVAQTNLLSYTISNLTNGKSYMYAISTISNGVEGNRSLANTFVPVPNIACSTLNDVGVYTVVKPLIGRKFTSTTLTATQKLSFIIKNYGTASQNSISVSYKINGGTIRTAILSDIVITNDTSIINFNTNEDLSSIGNYSIIAWTNLAADENKDNDTLYTTLKHLANAPIQLPFYESFEGLNEHLSFATFGLNGLEYADFYAEEGGRLRSNEGNLYAKSGNRAITLDNFIQTAQKKNELIFTYNLSNYIDSVIFLDLNYMNRAEQDSNDIIFARGDDTKPWVRIYNLFENRGNVAEYKMVREINLFQKLKIENNQNFSSSTQIKIQQVGNKAATSPYGNGGYTFDDFKLYNAGRDVSIISSNIKKANCTKTFVGQPLTIKVRNNSSQVITNLAVSYQVNNNPLVNGVIPVININDTATYTFASLVNYNSPGLYSIKIWTTQANDNNKQNDTLTTTMIVMETIDSFPYYNDFETNSGNLFSEGVNNSWLWTTPAKYDIDNAAQDNKAWTTGKIRGYNFSEDSYLYMGCMDFSGLTKDPLITFNFLSVMQTLSDSAYVEYSTDGNLWNRLGCYNCGLNWYNGYQSKPYWDRIIFPWQVVHTAVSLAALSNPSNFMYRIHLITDNFAVSEGLGIDDIHILKDYDVIAGSDSGYVAQTSTGNGWIQFTRNGRLVAELHDDNKNLGIISLGFEANTSKEKQFDNKNIFPRNWVIKPQNPIVGNYKLRLYVLNDEYTEYTIGEDSISRMGDIGLLRYLGLNTNLDAFDNHVKAYYKYFSPQQIQFYPYQNGYYIEFVTDTLGEFYLISTKLDEDAIQNVNLINFSAVKINDDVYLEWNTTREINSKEFVIQYSFDANTFINIDTVPAGGFSSTTTLYNFLHELNATTGIYYYRIKIVDNTNKVSYSLIDSVYFSPNVGVKQNTTNINAYISTNDIVIEMKNKLNILSVINIYNAVGQLQFTKKMVLSNGIQPLGISNFSNWSNGAYFLQIQTEDHNYYSKLIKQ